MIELADPDLFALIGSASGARNAATVPLAAARSGAAADSGVAVVTERVAFEAIRDAWRELDRAADGAVLFQSFDWCRAVFDHHERSGEAFRPTILTLRDGGRLVGILPLQRLAFGLTEIVTGFGEPYQQYSDVVLAPDAPNDSAERLLDAACRLPGCDGVNLLKVRDDSPLAPLLRARRAIRSNEDAAPFVDLRPFPSFKAYQATLNAKTRKNMRNTKNRLARSGTLAHRVLTDPAEIGVLIDRAHAGRERWLKEQGLTSRAFRNRTFAAFAEAVARPESGLSVMAMSLTLDGEPIADQWGFVFNNRYYAYVATWMPEYEEVSPGKLHLEEVIHACQERGIGIADFLIPAARYKFTWTNQATPVADYALPLSLSARMQFSLWSQRMRPLLKRIALRLPAGLRSRLAQVLLRR